MRAGRLIAGGAQTAKRPSTVGSTQGFVTMPGAGLKPFDSHVQPRPVPQQPALQGPRKRETEFAAVPPQEYLDKGLEKIQSSHRLFDALGELQAKAVDGNLTLPEFMAFRDTVLARAHLEPNDALIEMLDFVADKVYDLRAKRPAEAFYQSPVRNPHADAYVKTLGALLTNEDRRPQLRLAQGMVDKALTETLRAILIGSRGKIGALDYDAKVTPWLLEHSPDAAAPPVMKVRGLADAQTIQYSVETYVDKFADVLSSS